jgi:RimJ/RimL family protein N-acetyltransferase
VGPASEAGPRRAREEDLDAVAALYERARAFMRAQGNHTQWTGAYPARVDAQGDLAARALWVIDDGAEPAACLSLLSGPDPTYERIEGRGWLNDAPYWVVHRVAVGTPGRGLGSRCLRWACERHGNVRADTHESNLPMRRALERCGFVSCGTIWVADGTPRVAYHFAREGARAS